MVSEFRGFAITGYVNTRTPPEVAGRIDGLSYWDEATSLWAPLGQVPPTLSLDKQFQLAVWWLNLSAQAISGHVDLTITKPDRTEVTLNAALFQDTWVAPGVGQEVRFEPVTLDQAGTYQAKATLSALEQILDEQILDVAIVTIPPPFTFSNAWVRRVRCQSATAWNTLDFGCTISNPTDRAITHILTPMYSVETKSGYGDPLARDSYAIELTLNPGQSCNYYLPGNHPDRCTILLGFHAGVPYGGCAFLRDENGNDSLKACV